MNNPLYAVLVSPEEEYRKKILNGSITATIRLGYRDYRKECVMLCCHKKPWVVLANLNGVSCLGFRKPSDEDFKAAGFESREEIARWMKLTYPECVGDEGVTVIRWPNVRGALKEAA